MPAVVELLSTATPMEMGIVVCILSTLFILFYTLTR
jgi:hypothetical protein